MKILKLHLLLVLLGQFALSQNIAKYAGEFLSIGVAAAHSDSAVPMLHLRMTLPLDTGIRQRSHASIIQK